MLHGAGQTFGFLSYSSLWRVGQSLFSFLWRASTQSASSRWSRTRLKEKQLFPFFPPRGRSNLIYSLRQHCSTHRRKEFLIRYDKGHLPSLLLWAVVRRRRSSLIQTGLALCESVSKPFKYPKNRVKHQTWNLLDLQQTHVHKHASTGGFLQRNTPIKQFLIEEAQHLADGDIWGMCHNLLFEFSQPCLELGAAPFQAPTHTRTCSYHSLTW